MSEMGIRIEGLSKRYGEGDAAVHLDALTHREQPVRAMPRKPTQ